MRTPEAGEKVLALLIGIAAGSAVVWLGMPHSTVVNCGSSGSANSPLGASWGFDTPREWSIGADHWYNFTLVAIATGLHFSNMVFQVQLPTGAVVPPGPNWTMTGGSDSGTLFGTYAWTGSAAGTWVSGGTTSLQIGQTFSLLASPQTLSGDSLVIIGVGSGDFGRPFAGSLSVGIP